MTCFHLNRIISPFLWCLVLSWGTRKGDITVCVGLPSGQPLWAGKGQTAPLPYQQKYLSIIQRSKVWPFSGRKIRCLDSRLSSITAAHSSSFALLYVFHLLEWHVIRHFQCSWPRFGEICWVFGREGKKAGQHIWVIKCHFPYTGRKLDWKGCHQWEREGNIVQVLNRGQALRNTELQVQVGIHLSHWDSWSPGYRIRFREQLVALQQKELRPINACHKSRERLSRWSQAVGNTSLTSDIVCFHWDIARSEDPKTDVFQGPVSHR